MQQKFNLLRNPFHVIILAGLSLFFLGFISQLNKVDLDLFHEMALFREALNIGEIPLYDLYSYTPTIFPVVHHEWATGALLYFITVKLGLGANGLMFLKYLLTLFVVVSCYRFSMQQGANIEIFSWLFFFVILLGWIGFTTIRAQLFSLCFLVILLFLIEKDHQGDRYTFLMVLPLFTVWLNIHAGFVMGMVLLNLYILELFINKLFDRNSLWKTVSQLREKFLIIVLCCLLPFISPHGIDYYPYLWRALTLDRTDLITEWKPIWKFSFIFLAVFIAAQLVILYALSQKGFKKLPGLLMVIASAYSGMAHSRHLSIFSIIFMCYVPAYLADTNLGDLITKLWNKRKKFVSFFFLTIGIVGLSIALYNQFWRLKVPTIYDEKMKNTGVTYPVGAVTFLKKHQFVGNLMTPFYAGSYVSWKLYPNVKVSIDSRFEVAYHPKLVTEFFDFYEAKKGWQNTLAKYNTHALLIPNWSRVKNELECDMALQKKWEKVYSDGAYFIYMLSDIAKKFPVVDLGEATVPALFP